METNSCNKYQNEIKNITEKYEREKEKIKRDFILQNAHEKEHEKLLSSAIYEMGHMISRIMQDKASELIEEKYKKFVKTPIKPENEIN